MTPAIPPPPFRRSQGEIVADAAHAALAIESGCEWVTADTDFARFTPALRWLQVQRAATTPVPHILPPQQP